MTEAITVIRADGTEVNLDTCVERGVDGITGMMAIPAKRGGNLVVPGEHGELHIPAKKYGAANLVLPLWVRGVNPDGTIPADPGGRLLFHQNLRALVNLFVEDEQITLRHTLSDGSAREIVGEVLDAVEPEVRGSGRWTLGRFSVALRCADPFWSDLEPVTATVVTGGPQTLTEFAGASAPMEDLLLEFDPQANPRLEQPTSGIFVRVNRVIAAGQEITVDTAAWQIFGTPGVAPGLMEDLDYGGRGTTRWFALRPEPGGGAPVVELTNTSGTAGSVTVTGKRRYKIG